MDEIMSFCYYYIPIIGLKTLLLSQVRFVCPIQVIRALFSVCHQWVLALASVGKIDWLGFGNLFVQLQQISTQEEKQR